jgi:ABC-type branched-subunit amino acid transport system substrate-binding protein
MSSHQPITEERLVHGTLRTAIVAIAAAIALSSFYVAPHLTSESTSARQDQPGGGIANENGPNPDTPVGPTSSAGPDRGTGPAGGGGGSGTGAGPRNVPTGLSCPGNNGGKTDIGVDARNIYLAATEVTSGIGSSFLAPVRYGMLAVQQKVNRTGGICGRQLQLTLRDDGWDATKGKEFIDNFISQNYFALAVVPSSEGLNNASGPGGSIDSAPDSLRSGKGIPVVGSDGMLNSQYTDPWIWPVAASTATSMRIMEHDAHKKGAKTFGLVYNGSYKFGVEGAGAFKKQAERDGATVRCIEKLDASQNDYSNQVNDFNAHCGKQGPDGGVDFVALLLEPQTAETWLGSGNPYLGTRDDASGLGAGGPQPLFDFNFGNTCGQICANLEVWTSFYPPFYPYDQRSAVQTFKHDLCTVDPKDCNVDADSAFTEGGYVGMQLLVQALRQTSPYLTRQRLREALDSGAALTTGLSMDLAFHSGNHYANRSMVAFRDQYGQQFTGFQVVNGSEQGDPCTGCQDPPL